MLVKNKCVFQACCHVYVLDIHTTDPDDTEESKESQNGLKIDKTSHNKVMAPDDLASKDQFSVGQVYNCSLAQHVYVVPSSNTSPVDITVPTVG